MAQVRVEGISFEVVSDSGLVKSVESVLALPVHVFGIMLFVARTMLNSEYLALKRLKQMNKCMHLPRSAIILASVSVGLLFL